MSPKIDVNAKAKELEKKTPQEILGWALETFKDKVSLACSFGAEDVVLVDMLAKINPKARVFCLETGRLNQETYDLMDRIREKYPIQVEILFPEREAVEKMVRAKGMNLFYDSIENRKECCGVRKVQPLNKMLATLDAWITGLRRAQSVTRTDMRVVEIDEAHHRMIKINPLIHWSTEEVWAYLKANNVPTNKLHDQGYPSIGCEPCTRAVKPGEDERAGRWWWENPETKECGLHLKK